MTPSSSTPRACWPSSEAREHCALSPLWVAERPPPIYDEQLVTLESTATDPGSLALDEPEAAPEPTPAPPEVEARPGAPGDVFGAGGGALLAGLALLAAVASVTTRGLGPALPGVWVGVEGYINAAKMVGALSSQLFAVSSSAIVIGLVLALVRGDRPAYLRAFSVGVGVLTVLAVMIASAVALPDASRLVLAFGVGLLTALCATSAARFFTSRAPAITLGLLAASGLLRILVILLSQLAFERMSQLTADVARVLVTISAVPVAVAVIFALVWMVRVPGTGAALRWGALVVIMAGLGTLVALAQVGADPEAGGMPLLVARTLHEMGLRPRPFGPTLLYSALEALRWLTALAVLIVAPRNRSLAAAVSLALLAGGTLEVPLAAAGMVVAALVLVLQPGPTVDELKASRVVRQ